MCICICRNSNCVNATWKVGFGNDLVYSCRYTRVEIENRARKAIKQTMLLNIHDELPSDASILPVDCITGILALTGASRDREDFEGILQKLSRWLHPGGSVILVLVLNSDYYTTGMLKFPCVNLNTEFVLGSLSRADFSDVLFTVHPVPKQNGKWSYMFVSAKSSLN